MDAPTAEFGTPVGLPTLKVVPPPAEAAEGSPLGSARIRRRLTVEEVAARSGLPLEDVKSLEEGRIYRFPSVHRALAATLLYAAAIGVTEREARQLVGFPPGRRPFLRRWLAIAAFAAAVASLAWFVALPELREREQRSGSTPVVQAALPPPWEIRVDVFNGTETPNAATLMANEIGGPLAYRIGTVENADRLDYVQTRVYYPPGSSEIAKRLADALDVEMTGLPTGKDPNRLVVIVGRDRAGGPDGTS